jgi:hypothetical protein
MQRDPGKKIINMAVPMPKEVPLRLNPNPTIKHCQQALGHAPAPAGQFRACRRAGRTEELLRGQAHSGGVGLAAHADAAGG